ncbi:MAG: integration host factor subunit alpha [Tatlockia sp.]
MNALSKAMIVETLCGEFNLTKPDAKDMVDSFYESLRHALENGQHVKLSGFGNFTLRDKPERPGRNPKTGEEIPVVARRVVTFKPGLKLKTQIEDKR